MNKVNKFRLLIKEYKKIFYILSPVKKSLIFLFILSIVGGLTIIFEVNSLASIVNHLSSVDSNDIKLSFIIEELLSLIVVFVASILIRSCITPLRGWLSAYLNEGISEELKKKTYQKISKIKLNEFESPRYYDRYEQLNRLMNGRLVQAIVALATLLMAIIESFIIIYLLSKVSILMSLIIILGSLPLSYFLSKAYFDFSMINYEQTPSRRKKSYWQSLSTKRDFASELRIYQLSNYFMVGWNKVNQILVSELKKERRKLGIRTMGSQIGLLLLIGIGLVVTLHQGINGQLSIGIVVSTIYLLNRFENVINEILVSAEGILPVFFELKYIPEFFELPEEKEKENKIDQFQNIELDGVEFQYPGQEKATLKDITLKINKGERIAIVGANGSGKTTLAKLLLGLYEPTKGTIKINSQPTSKIDIFSWRKITGAVFQDFYRYKMSVRENIIGTFSNNHQFIEKVIESAKKAGIHNRINKLPYKYDTPLGKGYESAQELSGGEWQKIAISRAYYQDSQFLILDEPAASLDPHAEYDLYDSFYHLSKFKTLILITHRLSSTKLAERIIHLENGRIIEEGTHDELMQRKGKYAELYNNQAKWYLERGH